MRQRTEIKRFTAILQVQPKHWGCRGRRFKSCRPDLKSKQLVASVRGELFLFEFRRLTLFSRFVLPVQTDAPISPFWSVVFRNFLPGNHLASSNPVAPSERLRQGLGPRYAVVTGEVGFTVAIYSQAQSAEIDATNFTRKSPLVLAVWGPKQVTRFALSRFPRPSLH